MDRREDGREAGADLNLQSKSVTDLDQADVAPAVITLDVAAAVDRACCIGAGSDGGADQRASGNADAETDTKARVGLGVAACCNEAAGEREGRECGTGEFRLGQHGYLHPLNRGRPKWPHILWSRMERRRFKEIKTSKKSCACVQPSAGSENVEIP